MKKADIFIEVRDAWNPKTSENPELLGLLLKGMIRLVIYIKFDFVLNQQAHDRIKELQKIKKTSFLSLEHERAHECQQTTSLHRWASKSIVKDSWSSTHDSWDSKFWQVYNYQHFESTRSWNQSQEKSVARTGGLPCLTRYVFVYDTPGVFIPKIETLLMQLSFAFVIPLEMVSLKQSCYLNFDSTYPISKGYSITSKSTSFHIIC